MQVHNLAVIIEKDENGSFLAICPAMQGCYSDGETLEEALEMIKEVIKMHIENRLESGE